MAKKQRKKPDKLSGQIQFVRVLKMSYNLLFSALPAPVPLYLLLVALKL